MTANPLNNYAKAMRERRTQPNGDSTMKRNTKPLDALEYGRAMRALAKRTEERIATSAAREKSRAVAAAAALLDRVPESERAAAQRVLAALTPCGEVPDLDGGSDD